MAKVAWNGMRTAWNGPAVAAPASGSGASLGDLPLASYTSQSSRVVLSDVPGVVTTLLLPSLTRVVQLLTFDAPIWYALDQAPGPIPPPTTDTIVPVSTFPPGAVAEPNLWATVVLPVDDNDHTLQLLSEGISPVVVVVVYKEPSA